MKRIEQLNKIIEDLGEHRWHAACCGIKIEKGTHKLHVWLTHGSDGKELLKLLSRHGLRSTDVTNIGGFSSMTGDVAIGGTAQSLSPGIQIGFQLQAPFPSTAPGRLGCFVVKEGSDEYFLLSANHVLAMNGWARNDPTIPWYGDPTQIFGSPTSYCYPSDAIAWLDSVDYLRGNPQQPFCNEHECALAELYQTPANPGFPFPVKSKPQSPGCGDEVKIYTYREEKTQRVRYGKVAAICCHRQMRLEFGRFHFRNQFLVYADPKADPPFAEKGDSGSLIFRKDGTPLGMLYAGSPDDGLFLACTLGKFFADHNLSVLTGWPSSDAKRKSKR